MKPAEQGGSRAGDRLQRLAAVHRRGRLGRVGDPALDHRERLAGGRRRPARPALLQHRHLHLLLDRHQPQGAGAPGQGPAGRRPRVLRRRCARASARSARRSAPTQIDEITRLYGDFDGGRARSRSSRTSRSASMRITVERPLRVRWEITDDTLAAVEADAQARQARRRRARRRCRSLSPTYAACRAPIVERLAEARAPGAERRSA